MTRQRKSTPHPVLPNNGDAYVWFYRNPASIDVYVRPLDGEGNPLLQRPISFRLPLSRVNATEQQHKQLYERSTR